MVIGILAFAVGGAGALLSVVNAVVIRPLPVRDPEQLVLVTPGRGEARFGFNGATLAELQRQQSSFEGVCGMSRGGVTVDIPGLPTTLSLEAVSDNCDALLGRRAVMGRRLDERDRGLDVGAPGVAVVSYAFWKDALNADPDVVGRVIATPRLPLTIVGVAEPNGGALDADIGADLFVTLAGAALLRGTRNTLVVDAIGRLRSGTTLAAASAEVREIWPRVWAAVNPPGPVPSPASSPDSLRIESFARGLSTMRYRYGESLIALATLAVLLLILACVNVGGLLLSRALAREHELDILVALGAPPRRLLGRVIIEAVLLSTGAAAVSGLIAWSGSQALAASVWTSTYSMAMRVTPDPWIWWAIGVTGLIVGLVSAAPATWFVWHRRRSSRRLVGAARTITQASTTGRRALMVAQVALSFVLLFCASLFVRNLEGLRNLDPGYDPKPIRWSAISLKYGQSSNIDAVAYFRPVMDELRALPHVTQVALSTPFPGTELRHVAALPPITRTDIDGPSVDGHLNSVSPEFFDTLGVSIEEGRSFDWSDDERHPRVAVLNRAMATALFPNGDSVGRVVRLPDANGTTLKVVGVVSDVTPGDFRLTHLPRVYQSLAQDTRLMVTPRIVFRVAGDTGLGEDVRRVVEQSGRHRLESFRTIDAQSDIFFLRERVLAYLGQLFAALSAAIGALGLYALAAYAASRRVREAGIRMALGATRGRVLRLLASGGFQVIVVGIVIGIPISMWAASQLSDLLSTMASVDVVSLAAAGGLLLFAGGLACVLPAWSVIRTAVVDALRAE